MEGPVRKVSRVLLGPPGKLVSQVYREGQDQLEVLDELVLPDSRVQVVRWETGVLWDLVVLVVQMGFLV